nr:MAG TPA: hypothetical protein [Bacteriophage sp.]
MFLSLFLSLYSHLLRKPLNRKIPKIVPIFPSIAF